MQFTDEMAWDLADFAIVGAMLVGACGTYELAARVTDNATYRFAVGVALAAAFILVWLSHGVGIIGKDGDPANVMYFGVLAVGITGAIIARLQPDGMARALVATALARALVAAVALIAGLGLPWSGALELTLLNGFFVVLFSDRLGCFGVLRWGDPNGTPPNNSLKPTAVSRRRLTQALVVAEVVKSSRTRKRAITWNSTCSRNQVLSLSPKNPMSPEPRAKNLA
jgi:hypothetical protein